MPEAKPSSFAYGMAAVEFFGKPIPIAGAVIQWLRHELKLVDCVTDSEYMVKKVPDTNGCYVVPAFTGLGAPHLDQYAKRNYRCLNKRMFVRIGQLTRHLNQRLRKRKEKNESKAGIKPLNMPTTGQKKIRNN